MPYEIGLSSSWKHLSAQTEISLSCTELTWKEDTHVLLSQLESLCFSFLRVIKIADI